MDVVDADAEDAEESEHAAALALKEEVEWTFAAHGSRYSMLPVAYSTHSPVRIVSVLLLLLIDRKRAYPWKQAKEVMGWG